LIRDAGFQFDIRNALGELFNGGYSLEQIATALRLGQDPGRFGIFGLESAPNVAEPTTAPGPVARQENPTGPPGRPELIRAGPPGAVREWQGQPKRPDDVFARDYPLLPKINPSYRQGGDFATNCVLAAKFTDLMLEHAHRDPDEDPALGVYYQVPPMERVN